MTLLAEPTVQVDNERVRVTEWRFPPGATVHHRHAHGYVVVSMTTGRLLLCDAAGDRYAKVQAGKSYARNESAEHNVINANDCKFIFLEIEQGGAGGIVAFAVEREREQRRQRIRVRQDRTEVRVRTHTP
jgi:quercetin dioxygenase-like cupin family protein